MGRDGKFIQNFSRKKSEGTIPLGRCWGRWEDNIKIDDGKIE
jgi:hypothetical protein